MITEEIRELLADILMEVKLKDIALSLDPVSRSATITVAAIQGQDFEDLQELLTEMVTDASQP